MNTSQSQIVSSVTKRFFQHIARRQWTNAQALIHQQHKVTPTQDEEWKVGYITALQGMLTARRNNQTEHPPLSSK